MYDGFVERAEAVTALLGGPQTTFVVVSTLEVAPAREAEFFLELLAERRYHVGALVLNKVLPPFLLDQGAQDAATMMRNEAEKLAVGLAGELGDPEPERSHVTHVLSEMGQNFLDYQVVARREAEQRSELSASPELTLTVPYLDDDIHSLRGLLDLGERIWR
jgi:anion-transporting  ArsA/GET3 family ATPase